MNPNHSRLSTLFAHTNWILCMVFDGWNSNLTTKSKQNYFLVIEKLTAWPVKFPTNANARAAQMSPSSRKFCGFVNGENEIMAHYDTIGIISIMKCNIYSVQCRRHSELCIAVGSEAFRSNTAMKCKETKCSKPFWQLPIGKKMCTIDRLEREIIGWFFR